MQLFLHQKNWKFPWSSWETPELRPQLLDTSSCDGALIWRNGGLNTARVCCNCSKKSCDSCSKSIRKSSSYNLWTMKDTYPIPFQISVPCELLPAGRWASGVPQNSHWKGILGIEFFIMSWFPCQIWNISICEVHNSVRSIYNSSFFCCGWFYLLCLQVPIDMKKYHTNTSTCCVGFNN